MKVKETLNLAKTDFPMRAGLPNREPAWEKAWEDNKVYEKRQKLNEGKPDFILHDGPPFANGNIHMGHALNKVTKDIIVRYHSMAGYYSPYVPGWDTHGLPIEQQLAKKGVRRKEMSMVEYRAMCRDFALKEIDKQRTDFKRLGVSGDWDHPYITLQKEFEAEEIRVFGKMAEKGYIYHGLKPVYWSWSSESTLAEAEIEYKDVKSPSIYVAFPVKDGKGIVDQDARFIIWTTTPWTIPANQGIAVNPRFNYVQVKVGADKFVVAADMLSKVAADLDWSDPVVEKEFKGSDMDRMVAKHPLYDRDSLVINADHVTLDAGTGLVHTAPGHGEDDYKAGVKYNLPVESVLDEHGVMNENAPGFEGVFYDDANKLVTKALTDKGALLKLSFFTHSYPHDWRTKKPVVFRATTQWFASVDAFRQQILDQIEKVNFKPAWGKTRLYNMIRDRGDWVISRQRAWGVPLPIFYAEDGTPILEKATIDHVADLFGKYGSSYWFEKDAKDLLPEGYTNEHSPHGEFTKETDIMDVWFDSGSSHQAVLAQRPELSFPAALYLEGSDQYRGWFNSSLITSVATTGIAPYKGVLSQGFTLDANGQKMSKSLGNTIAPDVVEKQYGAEIIRLWVATVDASSDVRVSMDNFAQASDAYRKIRNTMRFMIANTTDFDPTKDAVQYADLGSVDKYMLVRLNDIVKQSRAAYEDYEFAQVNKLITSFLVNDLSAFYLDFAKDVVYIEAADDIKRRRMQTVMFDVLVALTKLLLPILPHTAEEIWPYLHQSEEFAYLSEMPEVQTLPDAAAISADWAKFMSFRGEVQKALEEARNAKVIGKSLEASVTVYPTAELADLLTKLDANVMQLLIVSDFKLEAAGTKAPADAVTFADGAITVKHAEGEVCERCRMIKSDVGSDDAFPMLCGRCANIVRTNFPAAVAEGLESKQKKN
ncbi:isoleucine--tRNA ligase [Lacticaseibacillus sharpeae]|uniref:Isoleucine--tRNA ligase n=1 Tax=Lacticaseibacillus sharpeae JCM 1186 = DSM 20505 TaxID=1291052 RepID=A0A0R1ZNL1_9LACO|nr:isoleucine--tRNA ligase [Lacticaseibacillus sharpeae]KRM56615.1 isoleucyl-tRNA synthetase [Lacticaseibacillus sharpeae JCM 1186 = DSM 20505]